MISNKVQYGPFFLFFFFLFRLIGVVFLIIGLYAVLWGKAKDHAKSMKTQISKLMRRGMWTFRKLRLCLVTVFVFYFQKLIFGNIKKKTIFLYFWNQKYVITTHPWCGDHSISISVCRVWKAKVEIQVSKRELHTHIHLD